MTTTKPPVLTDDDEEFNNWHVSYANRAPYLNAPEGMWVDDKKAYAAWKYAKEQAVLERAGADAVRDAERYRWLRCIGRAQLNVMAHHSGDSMDQEIDAAIAASKGAKP